MIILDEYNRELVSALNYNVDFSELDESFSISGTIKFMKEKISTFIDKIIEWFKQKFAKLRVWIMEKKKKMKEKTKKTNEAYSSLAYANDYEDSVYAPDFNMEYDFYTYSKILFSQIHNQLIDFGKLFRTLSINMNRCETGDDVRDYLSSHNNDKELFNIEKAKELVTSFLQDQSSEKCSDLDFDTILNTQFDYSPEKREYKINNPLIAQQVEKYNDTFDLYNKLMNELLSTAGPSLVKRIKDFLKRDVKISGDENRDSVVLQTLYDFLTGLMKFNTMVESLCSILMHKLDSVFIPIIRAM